MCIVQNEKNEKNEKNENENEIELTFQIPRYNKRLHRLQYKPDTTDNGQTLIDDTLPT